MVAVARYGLILWENEAAGVRKVFRYLPDLWDTITKSKMAAKFPPKRNTIFYNIYTYIHGVGGMGGAL